MVDAQIMEKRVGLGVGGETPTLENQAQPVKGNAARGLAWDALEIGRGALEAGNKPA